MNGTVDWFKFTPKSGEKRNQEIHRTSFGMFNNASGEACLHMWIETTRPGDTTDDRGQKDWDMTVQVDLMMDPIDFSSIGPEGRHIENVLAAEKWNERFLYYWDHSDFVQAEVDIMPLDAGWAFTFKGHSHAGDAVHFKVDLSL